MLRVNAGGTAGIYVYSSREYYENNILGTYFFGEIYRRDIYV